MDVLDLLVSDAIGQRSWVQSWSVRTVEVFSDVDTDWCRLKTAVMKLSGKRGFRFKERHNGSCLVLRSDKNKCPWALVFYDKQAEEEHKTGTATKWSQGRVRVEVRAWSKPAVDRLADGNGTTLADVLLRGDFVGFFRWAFDRVHLHEGLTVDPKGTLQNAGFRGATLKRISSLLAAVDERGWSSVLDNPPEGYADEKGNRRLRADVLRLEKLGVVLPDREENALLGDVCRSVAGSVRDHQRERTRWPGIYEYFGFEPPVAVVLEEPLSSDVIAEVVAEGSSAAHRPPFVFVRVRPVPLFRPRKGVVVPMRFMDGVGIHARGP